MKANQILIIFITLFSLLFSSAIKAQDSINNTSRFEQWLETDKKHAAVLYNGSIYQYGFNAKNNTQTLNNDMGIFYRGYLIEKKNYHLHLQAWGELSSILAGSSTKEFSKELNMFSAINSSSTEGHNIALEYFYFENFLFDQKLNISFGKIDPTFITTYTQYAGWDRYSFFSKTSSSDPIPPMDPGFGFLSEFKVNRNIKLGIMMVDNESPIDFIDPIHFFKTNSYSYQGYAKFSISGSRNLHSEHILSLFYVEANQKESSSKGFTYVGNQEVREDWILIAKASKAWGRVDKYNSAYSMGLIKRNPFNRNGDHLGLSLQMNEKEGVHEYGIDSYYKFFMTSWLSGSVNVQVYQTEKQITNVIPGLRLLVTY